MCVCVCVCVCVSVEFSVCSLWVKERTGCVKVTVAECLFMRICAHARKCVSACVCVWAPCSWLSGPPSPPLFAAQTGVLLFKPLMSALPAPSGLRGPVKPQCSYYHSSCNINPHIIRHSPLCRRPLSPPNLWSRLSEGAGVGAVQLQIMEFLLRGRWAGESVAQTRSGRRTDVHRCTRQSSPQASAQTGSRANFTQPFTRRAQRWTNQLHTFSYKHTQTGARTVGKEGAGETEGADLERQITLPAICIHCYNIRNLHQKRALE